MLQIEPFVAKNCSDTDENELPEVDILTIPAILIELVMNNVRANLGEPDPSAAAAAPGREEEAGKRAPTGPREQHSGGEGEDESLAGSGGGNGDPSRGKRRRRGTSTQSNRRGPGVVQQSCPWRTFRRKLCRHFRTDAPDSQYWDGHSLGERRGHCLGLAPPVHVPRAVKPHGRGSRAERVERQPAARESDAACGPRLQRRPGATEPDIHWPRGRSVKSTVYHAGNQSPTRVTSRVSLRDRVSSALYHSVRRYTQDSYIFILSAYLFSTTKYS